MMGRPLGQACRWPFPGLREGNHRVSSPSSGKYNCIAWAYEVSNKWMWPGNLDAYWPSDVTAEDALTALIQVFVDNGYEECEDSRLESGFKKVAIFTREDGPQHAARQLESGRWTSKLGAWEDIEHDNLEALECKDYGKATVFLRKRND